jgi:hypothetical protein
MRVRAEPAWWQLDRPFPASSVGNGGTCACTIRPQIESMEFTTSAHAVTAFASARTDFLDLFRCSVCDDRW